MLNSAACDRMKMLVFLVLFLTFLSAYAPLQTEALNVRGHLLKSKTWLLLGVMRRNGCSTCTPFDVTDRALLEGKSQPACKVYMRQVSCVVRVISEVENS
jgi:hypothetical protein